MRDLLGLRDRPVLVIGAGGGGIGTGICAALAAAGARVVAVDRDPARLADAAGAVAAEGGVCVPIVADAGERGSVEAAVARARETAGPLHGLVNVVGGLPLELWQSLLRYEEATLDGLLDTNLRCAFLASQAFARELERQGSGGSLVQIASIAALHGMPFGAGYALAKAALLSLARTMALEWGPLGIRVNCVAPGTIRVPRAQAHEDAARDRAALPLGRRGAPQYVAGAVLYLLSDLAAWVTGQVIAVDGGASVKPAYLDETGLPVFVSDPALRARLRR
jgi:NAD(P)-dependent dehydrogenase (short-subunit alcohol dehydrogenase family)